MHLSQKLEDLRQACNVAKSHLYAAKTQRASGDDQIIAGHIDAAYAALAELNAGVPEPVTSMHTPGYWESVLEEFRADVKAGRPI